jgi:UTP--glucose-1-phosphate uridylyltransferase
LEKQGLGEGNEVQLTDAIDTLNKKQRVFAKVFNGNRYDVGNKFGFLKTNIEYGLKHPETKDELKTYIKELAKELEEK